MFAPTVARALAIAMLHSQAPLSVAEVARFADLPYAVAKSALATLAKRGVLTQTDRMGTLVYGPDRNSLHYPSAHRAALVELPWIREFAAAGIGRARVKAIIVHGSSARGDMGTNSDLDVIFVGALTPTEGIEVAKRMSARIGRHVDPAVYRTEDLRERLEAGDRALESAIKNGVTVWGKWS